MQVKDFGRMRFRGLKQDIFLYGGCRLCLHALDPIVGRGMRRKEASGPSTFGLHQPRQGGRHDVFAIAPCPLKEFGAMAISRVFRVPPIRPRNSPPPALAALMWGSSITPMRT